MSSQRKRTERNAREVTICSDSGFDIVQQSTENLPEELDERHDWAGVDEKPRIEISAVTSTHRHGG